MDSLSQLAQDLVACTRCPRLRAHCQAVAAQKVRRFRHETYWGLPVPGFGDPEARLLVVGLAPAAHGANRTGRMFTGDESGRWLYGALYRHGFANQPDAVHRDDGLVLRDAYITAACRCAPPDNRPTAAEIAQCRAFLVRELALLPRVQVVLALGRIAFAAYLDALRAMGHAVDRPAFAHGAAHRLGPHLPVLVCSYHPSQQNTRTGRLTAAMWDQVFRTVRSLIPANGAGPENRVGGGG